MSVRNDRLLQLGAATMIRATSLKTLANMLEYSTGLIHATVLILADILASLTGSVLRTK
ncbi:hypothetical protein BV20DRAFT_962051 [Pilatotrama ljubarskyi]|nr:hypothetical protein BV20DRAFT_962051 [Pilatotrama ljubarskyi]